MSLADCALNPVPAVGVGWTCHPATWYWAALEANGPLDPATRAGNIVNLAPNAQGAMLALLHARAWNFVTDGMPGLGTVMLWTTGPTHSAVSTIRGIAGYNQACICGAVPNAGHTFVLPAQLNANMRKCQLIMPQTILAAAAHAHL